MAAFQKMQGRFVVEGKLGCPVCSATYDIMGGVADFGSVPISASIYGGEENDPMRFAAMLNLTRPGLLVVLAQTVSTLALSVSELTEAKVIAVNSTDGRADDSDAVVSISAGKRLPLGSNSVDAMFAVSASDAVEALRLLKSGGRVVVPSSVTLDGQFRQLARDGSYIVAESVGQLVTLSR